MEMVPFKCDGNLFIWQFLSNFWLQFVFFLYIVKLGYKL